MSPEVRLMIAPRAAYAALARRPDPLTPLAALRRPLLAAAVLGIAVSISGTGRVTPTLVLSTTIMWSYVIVVQVMIALLLIVAAPAARTVSATRALDLFFAGQAPWSLTLLAVAACAPLGVTNPRWVWALVAVVPFWLTLRIVDAFFREVMGLDPRRALFRTLAHQAMTWTFALALVALQSALAPRILGALGRS